MQKFKKLQNVKMLDKKEQKNVKGGWGTGCPRPRMFFCEPGICVPWGTNCP